MGKLGGIGTVSFQIFGGDHNPPHFHAIAWATANRDRLIAEWNAWNPTIPF